MFARSALERLQLNSKNSSQPPSQNKFKKETPLSSDAQSDALPAWVLNTSAYWKRRKPGAGQKLLPMEQVNTIIPCYPGQTCPHCMGTVRFKGICRRKQVIDLPQTGLHVT